ncbi:MAG TPA: MMPL family transporter, partial [Propionibacterium sp.]|nr:MMPL family transporter [Propionibacterium sp.]
PAGGAPAGMPPLPLVSEDGTAAFGTISIDATEGAENRDAIAELRTELAAEAAEGVTVQVTGPAGIRADLGAVFDGANFRLLAGTAAVVALLLLLTYRSPILWIIPLLVVGLADRLAAILATHTLRLTDVPWDESTIGILSVLVFGAGTNYALLIISRYRDELRGTDDRFVAMRGALRHAGEAVITSASTVVLGVLTLLLSVFPATRGLGLASAVGIVIAAGYALVVLPAVLVLFNRWVFWPLIPRVGDAALVESDKSLWARVGNQVARRPAVFIAASLALIAVMSAGLFRIETGLGPSDQFLRKPEAIVALERLGESFPAGESDPALVITEDDPERVVEIAETVPGVASATVGETADELTKVSVVLEPEPGSDEARQTIRDLRTAFEGLDMTVVGGTEAQALDSLDGSAEDQRTIIPLILGLVLGILILLLRSLVAPLILVATVVGTYAAALGASWVLFVEVLGFERLDSSVPLLTFLFLVALGIDYNIFLVTRAREEGLKYGSKRGMLRALTATGGVITSAGILLAAVFAVLGVLPLVVLAQIGVVIGVGVLLDTLLVRTVLVPAIAILLGDAFWWPRRTGTAGRRALPAGDPDRQAGEAAPVSAQEEASV